MVHGEDWPVHRPVTIMLVGIRHLADPSASDDRGTFNYVINQDHEFFAGGLPPASTRSASPTSAAPAPRPGVQVNRAQLRAAGAT